jgi:hypothetical protein
VITISSSSDSEEQVMKWWEKMLDAVPKSFLTEMKKEVPFCITHLGVKKLKPGESVEV